ncbi:hypothetical protein GCM10027035_40000 [Emticicia sediminis]
MGILTTIDEKSVSFWQADKLKMRAEIQMIFFIVLSYFVDTNVESQRKNKCRLDDQNWQVNIKCLKMR